MNSDTAQGPTSCPDYYNFGLFDTVFDLENVVGGQKVWYQNFSLMKLRQNTITQKRYSLKNFFRNFFFSKIFFENLKKKEKKILG